MQNGIHYHFCPFCKQDYECAAVTHCSLPDIVCCYDKICRDLKKAKEKK